MGRYLLNIDFDAQIAHSRFERLALPRGSSRRRVESGSWARQLTPRAMYICCPCTPIVKGADMAGAVERIVVQATPQDKRAIAAKAKKLGLPISELMRRGAFDYESADSDQELEALAQAAQRAAERAGAAIDDALAFIDASNKRIAGMEAKASKAARRRQAA
jgi:hypothetical protein